MNEIHQLLRSHRSIRAFTGEALPDDTVRSIVECAQAAATSSNVQATTVIRVRDEATRERISEVTGGQKQVITAGAFLIFCADLHRSGEAAARHGSPMTGGMTEQFIIATVDVALAAQNAVIAAESLGLGVCYIGAIRNDPQVVVDLLGLPDDVYPVFGLCIGEPAEDPEVKPRLPVEVVLKEGRYHEDGDARMIEDYDDTIREYYRTRSGGTKDSCWSEEMARLVGTERRPHMRAFLEERGFDLR